MQTIVLVICAAGIALSAKSTLVLGRLAPWTSAGWVLTIVYFIALIVRTAARVAIPAHGEYIVLAALTLAFVIAGVRDEPQAEPWWWPVRRGSTRAEKHA